MGIRTGMDGVSLRQAELSDRMPPRWGVSPAIDSMGVLVSEFDIVVSCEFCVPCNIADWLLFTGCAGLGTVPGGNTGRRLAKGVEGCPVPGI